MVLQKNTKYYYIFDLGAVVMALLAHQLQTLGYPDQAAKMIGMPLKLARELSHPHTLAMVLFHSASVHKERIEPPAGRHLIEESIALCHTHGFSLLETQAQGKLGVILFHEGKYEAAITEIRLGFDRAVKANPIQDAVWWHLDLAEAYRRLKQPTEGLKELDRLN